MNGNLWFTDMLFQTVDTFLAAYIVAPMGAISGLVLSLVVGVGTLMILIYGYQLITGTGASFQSFMMRFGTFFIYAAVASGFGVLAGSIVTFFFDAANWLVEVMSGTAVGGGGATGGYQNSLHNYWSQVWNWYSMMQVDNTNNTISQSWWQMAKGAVNGQLFEAFYLKLELLVVQFEILLGAVLFTLGSAIIYIMAKIGLTVVMVFAPIFIFAGGFQNGRSYFSNWVSQGLNYVFVIGLTGALFGLSLALTNTLSTSMTAAINGIKDFKGWLGAVGTLLEDGAIWVCLSLILLYFAYQIPGIASGLVGGAQMHLERWLARPLNAAAGGHQRAAQVVTGAAARSARWGWGRIRGSNEIKPK